MDKSFFTYKGFPLVRHEDVIYYGNMSDDYVVMLKILNKKKVHDIDVASKIKVYQMSTDLTLPPNQAVTKTSEKESLYEALDLANAWLSRTAKH
ncbi:MULTISPECIES: hypothetical protein [Porcipelethomonas]|jgi:hypothetical protein|uniref:hypothetical protein n=1 Tax=Porcipelethomonas TaxID=2981643 RepID=UPI0008203F6B|nr:hypothetical protein [Porcipelethomonas ammoniilytica]MBS6315290.1 hypothetical protein [Ruminococcus sp.]MEE0185488.1 hypothetical protein [Oscillospiraceae bacterium]OLA69847.1 MAG: hypothetical protein BHW52_07215 [Ruminococcus sp. 37_24]SCI96994.1 Uncharacterised protein [uncultured Ruminococcus sp.]MCU6719921.1 hypothetical protein [Porcipelethomonas ammoniilytica]